MAAGHCVPLTVLSRPSPADPFGSSQFPEASGNGDVLLRSVLAEIFEVKPAKLKTAVIHSVDEFTARSLPLLQTLSPNLGLLVRAATGSNAAHRVATAYS
jgi:hypothetical protein